MDGFRFLDAAARAVMKAWCEREPTPETIPRVPLAKPLDQARVALVTSAGIALRSDVPFDQEGERKDPWWGDPTHRVLPHSVTREDIAVHHLHIDPRPAEQDLDCVLPARRLDELVEAGVVGAAAPNHVSFMGYILEPTQLVQETAPAIAAQLNRDEVDLALLTPV